LNLHDMNLRHIRRKANILQVVSLALVAGCFNPALADIDEAGPLENFARVAPCLYRGAQPSYTAFKDLKFKGIKTIISLRLDDEDVDEEKNICAKYDMRFYHIPMGYKTPDLGSVLSFLGIVTNPQLQPVYVHCRFGSDRTGTMVGLYRVIVENWSYPDAYQEMRQYHFKPFLLSLKHAVRDYANTKPTDKKQILANSRLTEQL